jgi:hypothetical protein
MGYRKELMTMFTALLPGCLALLALVPQQDTDTPKPKADPFEAIVKATHYDYKTDKDGDYQVEIEWGAEKRSQLVVIRGTGTAIVEPKEPEVASREIWGLCWKGKEKPGADVLEKLATKHYKLGAFQVEKSSNGTWSAYYRVDVPDNATPAFVRQAIRITAEAADDMEKELLGTDDF